MSRSARVGKAPPEQTSTIQEIRRQRQERHDVQRWAEVSLWPVVRDDFLRWYADRKPEVPERDSATQPDPKWLLFASFYRETGGDYYSPNPEEPSGPSN